MCKKTKKNIVIILQARVGASRLPGKPLREVLGRPLLSYQLERLRRVKLADGLVVATTTNPHDLRIVDLCTKEQIASYEGSEWDVLDRYYQTAKIHQADVIVRVTGDCPLIDPDLVDQVISYYLHHTPELDYASNSLERTYPRGLDTEVFSYSSLERAYKEACHKEEREHVTPYFYLNPKIFSLGSFKQSIDQSHHRWTVDTAEDLQLITNILTELYPFKETFTTSDILKALDVHPEWLAINAHIQQKPLDL